MLRYELGARSLPNSLQEKWFTLVDELSKITWGSKHLYGITLTHI